MQDLVTLALQLTSLVAPIFNIHGPGAIAASFKEEQVAVDWQQYCPAQHVDYFAKPLYPICRAKAYDPRTQTTSDPDTVSISITKILQVPTEEVIITKTLVPASSGSSNLARSDTTPSAIIQSSGTPTILSEISNSAESSSTPESKAEIEGESDSAFDLAHFLSFEEWKQQNLAKAGQSTEHVGQRGTKGNMEARRRPDSINALESYGDDAEIEIDFSGFGSQHTASKDQEGHVGDQREILSNVKQDIGMQADTHKSEVTSGHPKSKDAGKTCKERSNYASFDCAATVLKTNPECKGANSVLVENKDSYMLNKCAASNKFFIVELCNDILIDTIVLANYEFFSSMFRTFKVSVSDRYPVKLDKWKEIGTYEARNTREIQAFLVENPLIWAKYLRIEFLSQYGNEYYCPVSLLRVHGTTMMEEFNHELKASRGEDESDGDVEEETVQADPQVVVAEPVHSDAKEAIAASTISQDQSDPAETMAPEPSEKEPAAPKNTDVAKQPVLEPICQLPEQLLFSVNGTTWPCDGDARSDPTTTPCAPAALTPKPASSRHASSDQQDVDLVAQTVGPSNDTTAVTTLEARPPSTETSLSSKETITTVSTPSVFLPTDLASSGPSVSTFISSPSTSSGSSDSRSSSMPTAKDSPIKPPSSSVSTQSSSLPMSSAKASSPPKPATSSSPPPTQESFFKSVHKRLQLLESNSTLSLQYIESQSVLLRDAFSKVEKRQINKTAAFLEALNATVLGELKSFREQYDAMWMESVREMGAQRLEAQREIKSLTTSLMEVKKDVYWQQRIAVLQFTILVLGLGFVIFSRGPTDPHSHLGENYMAQVPFQAQAMNGGIKDNSTVAAITAYETPPASPSTVGPSPRFSWLRKASPRPENPQQRRPRMTREKSLPALPDDGRFSSSPSPSPGLPSPSPSSTSSSPSRGGAEAIEARG